MHAAALLNLDIDVMRPHCRLPLLDHTHRQERLVVPHCFRRHRLRHRWRTEHQLPPPRPRVVIAAAAPSRRAGPLWLLAELGGCCSRLDRLAASCSLAWRWLPVCFPCPPRCIYQCQSSRSAANHTKWRPSGGPTSSNAQRPTPRVSTTSKGRCKNRGTRPVNNFQPRNHAEHHHSITPSAHQVSPNHSSQSRLHASLNRPMTPRTVKSVR